mmetsp:Transcript_147780/g.474367  ORF Transcript_147780/g.474367 Transcript_147780/m.474367 type:complete len:232 (+) Transcript_147780:3053-3748(+)
MRERLGQRRLGPQEDLQQADRGVQKNRRSRHLHPSVSSVLEDHRDQQDLLKKGDQDVRAHGRASGHRLLGRLLRPDPHGGDAASAGGQRRPHHRARESYGLHAGPAEARQGVAAPEYQEEVLEHHRGDGGVPTLCSRLSGRDWRRVLRGHPRARRLVPAREEGPGLGHPSRGLWGTGYHGLRHVLQKAGGYCRGGEDGGHAHGRLDDRHEGGGHQDREPGAPPQRREAEGG